MIIAGDRYALTEKENNMYAIEMILHIKRLQSSDFGGYKCISKNSIGDTEGTIRLYGVLIFAFFNSNITFGKYTAFLGLFISFWDYCCSFL